MIAAMFLSFRHRFRVILTLVLCLLFQQLAMAGYSCPGVSAPVPAAAMANECAGMSTAHTQENPVLCGKHCSQDRPLLTDHASPVVPALALPPILFAVLSQSGNGTALLATQVPVDTSDPPPRLRFCSLLI